MVSCLKLFYWTAASICFQHCEGPKSLPSTPVTSSFLLFASLPFPSFSRPLRSSPFNPARGSGECCKLPQWGLGRSPTRQRFWCILMMKKRCWSNSRCTVSNNRKRLFLTFYGEIFQELTIAFILQSHYCEGPSHRGPSQLINCEGPDLRTLAGSTPMLLDDSEQIFYQSDNSVTM